MWRKQIAATLDRRWFQIQAKSEDEAEILIYDYIGWGGIWAATFVKELQGITAKRITLRLNTPGGDVFDGLAIYNALRAHPATVVSRVEGLAASIGSIIALAGEQVTMSEGTFMMVHNAWGLAMGSARDMREMAELLDKVSGSLAEIYSTRSGATLETVKGWMDAETWFTAAEAKNAGLATAIVQAPAARAEFDLSGYTRVPESLRAARTDVSVPVQTEEERVALMRRRLAVAERC